MRIVVWLSIALLLLAACAAPPAATTPTTAEPAVREGTSLLGEPLLRPTFAPDRRARLEADLAAARRRAAAEPNSEMADIWLGRRLAYLGRHRAAIEVYSEALTRHPDSYRLLRHRGHRHLTLRRLDAAIADLERAAALAEPYDDEIEPDGAPNAAGVPRSTTKFNIWYHLALARYLLGDDAAALGAWGRCQELAVNDDLRCAATYWHHLTLRRLGEEESAAALLEPIHASMDVLENHDYLALLMLFNGERRADELLAAAPVGSVSFATIGCGVATLLLLEGDELGAIELYERIVTSSPWPAFGHLAAESELARLLLFAGRPARNASGEPPGRVDGPRGVVAAGPTERRPRLVVAGRRR